MPPRTVSRPALRPKALAVAAHPDDIEFYMAGTLLLLGQAGYETHYLTLANGSCGSLTHTAQAISGIRLREAKAAAKTLGAQFHAPFCNDLEILYDLPTLRRLAALVREVRPTILLVHSPQDYMEDHSNACRLAVTAAFARGMPNFRTQPPRRPIAGDVTIYHAMPHGLRDGLRRRVWPGAFVETTPVQATKRCALAAHQSQKTWLDASQGMDSYLRAMEELSLAVGKMSRRFQHAEGWRRHLHLGFCAEGADPLRDALGRRYLVNRAYEAALEAGF
jgi:LmbE family N-acetylglucosaminyl deacetylase